MNSVDTAGEPAGAPLGPGSLTWRYFGDRRGLLLLGYAGTLQNMHPAVGAALQQHSNFFDDPWDRLIRSLPPILGVVYDPPAAGTGTVVRDFHSEIKGVDHHDRRYHALDPEVFWWTHVTFVESMIRWNEVFGTPLTLAEKDLLVAEGVTWWRRYGLSTRPVFGTYAEFETYWQQMLDTELERNATTDYALGAADADVPAPPGMPRTVWPLIRRPAMRLSVWITVALLPVSAREILGVGWSERDQRRFAVLAAAVRRVVPLLPARWRYLRRARQGMPAGSWRRGERRTPPVHVVPASSVPHPRHSAQERQQAE